jgi:hypothetical protein
MGSTQFILGGLQVADAPKPALWRRSVEPAPANPQSITLLRTYPPTNSCRLGSRSGPISGVRRER